jgi:hypothetical protein
MQLSMLDHVDLSNPPINPASIVQINVTGGPSQEMNYFHMPEPSPVALFVVAGGICSIRRARRI